MSGELPFIDIDGVEVANGYRTLAYLRRGLGAPNWEVPGVYPCAVLAREVGGVGPFTSPSADPAPWYDATVPESAEFLGFVPKLDFQTLDVKRGTTQRFGSLGGGVIGVEQLAVRGMKVEGMLIASTCPGLEYGRHWLYSRIGSDCDGCMLRTIRVRESCPPADGTNDTRGERILYDAALIGGIQRTDSGGANCCDYDGLSFEFASQSPYLYTRPGAATTAAELAGTASAMVPLPAVLDTFVRANTGPPPSASWTQTPYSPFGTGLRVLSNQLENSAAAAAGAYWNPNTFGPDCAVTIVYPVRVTGQFQIFARLTTPGTATGEAAFLEVNTVSAGSDFLRIGRVNVSGGYSSPYVTSTGFTWAAGDTFALVCRGRLLEGWRKPSGGVWTRIASIYNSTGATPVAGYAGIGINSPNATGVKLGAFGAGTLTNGSIYPHDVVSIPVPSVPVGITSPIVTLKATGFSVASGGGFDWTTVIASGIRVQMKKNLSECDQTDAFAVDDLATRWTLAPAASFTITGGHLKPAATGSTRTAKRRLATGAAVAFKGGRVEAQFTLGTTLTGGVWGVNLGYGAYLVKASNTFQILNASNGGTSIASVAFTPVASTTYRIILEMLPTGPGIALYNAYLLDATGAMLVAPLSASPSPLNPLSATYQPAIDVIPADLAEAYDSFYAIDYSDEADYITAAIPPGTLTIDASRRVSQFKSNASGSVAVEGSPYLNSPTDAPLGWPELCAGDGPGCLQVWSEQGSFSGNTVSVALQNRQR